MAKVIKRQCPACGEVKAIRADCKTCGCGGTNPFRAAEKSSVSPADSVKIQLAKLREKRLGKDSENAELQRRVLDLEQELEAVLSLKEKTPQVHDIPARVTSSKSESAAVAVWSDWHIEEEVTPGLVGNRNHYNLDISKKRFENLCRGTIAWYHIESAKTEIKTIVIAALGDFISGSIHEDLAESNLLAPSDAIYRAQNMLISGIQHTLGNTGRDVQIIVVCHSGNHGRMTKKQRIATEAGNSLEQYMYYNVRDFFRNEPRVKFQIAEGYHSFLRFFEGRYEIRFHHGHMMSYWGGVGGLTIPVNKSIAQWNKAHTVDLDVFGHFHQKFDGGNFICNGSMIGYNAFSIACKGGYELPSQQFFLVNREYAQKTMVAPIFLD